MKIKKSKKANLEDKRLIFFEIGMILTLAFVLMAFEWNWPEKHFRVLDFNRTVIVEEDMTGIYEKKKEVIPPKPKIIAPIIVPDNTEEPTDDELFNPEDSPEVTNDLDGQNWDIPEIEPEDVFVHKYVAQMPEFPGGESALMEYLSKTVKYCPDALDVGISGTVFVSFVVWKDGGIRNISIKRSISDCLDKEVIRAVENMPRWNPGMQNGKKVNVEFVLPVTFKLN